MECDDELKSKVLSNIVLSGGHSMFNGLRERLENELKILFKLSQSSEIEKNSNLLKLVTSIDMKYGAWIGGSIMASIMKNEIWVDQTEYNEVGPSIVHFKCQ